MSEASALLLAELPRLAETAPLGPFVDLACGRGRNARAAAGHGLRTVGIDRSAEFLAELRAAARAERLPIGLVRADLEGPHGLPLRAASCGAIGVFRFLHRPLLPRLAEALAPGGLLLYETFTIHQRDLPYGPNNPAFLLQEGELARSFPGLRVLHRWEGASAGPRPFALARLVAQRPGPGEAPA